jgi:hypothetical protein
MTYLCIEIDNEVDISGYREGSGGGGENEEHELDARNLFGEPDGSQTGRGESFEDDELFRNVLL